jgi:hypothetical protein
VTATHADADYWAGYRFRPRLIAATEAATWVVEDHLPLLVRIEPDGSVGEPRPVGRRDESSRGAHELAATADAVWIRWHDGVTRLDASDGTERWLPLSAASLAAGDAGVWALSGDGRVVRIDPNGGDYVTLGEAEVRRHTIAVGHGAVWTLTWTSVPGGSTLSRIDPLSGRASAQLAIEGSPRRLLVDTGAVWVRVWRHGAGESVEEVLVSVDPDSVDARGEVTVSPTGSGGPVLDGVLWAPDVDPYAHHARGAPSTVRRIDAYTGHLLGAVEAPGWVTGLTAGPAAVWGCLERLDNEPAVIELAADGLTTRVVSLHDAEVADHLPSRHRGSSP